MSDHAHVIRSLSYLVRQSIDFLQNDCISMDSFLCRLRGKCDIKGFISPSSVRLSARMYFCQTPLASRSGVEVAGWIIGGSWEGPATAMRFSGVAR